VSSRRGLSAVGEPGDIPGAGDRTSVAELAAAAWTVAERVDATDAPEGLRAMFAYYDAHGLSAGTLPLRALLGRPSAGH
jgi:hypothetical protein